MYQYATMMKHASMAAYNYIIKFVNKIKLKSELVCQYADNVMQEVSVLWSKLETYYVNQRHNHMVCVPEWFFEY